MTTMLAKNPLLRFIHERVWIMELCRRVSHRRFRAFADRFRVVRTRIRPAPRTRRVARYIL